MKTPSRSLGRGGLAAGPHTPLAGSARLLPPRWGRVCERGCHRFHSPWHGNPQPGVPPIPRSPGAFLRTLWRDTGYGGKFQERE